MLKKTLGDVGQNWENSRNTEENVNAIGTKSRKTLWVQESPSPYKNTASRTLGLTLGMLDKILKN